MACHIRIKLISEGISADTSFWALLFESPLEKLDGNLGNDGKLKRKKERKLNKI
jgi:hypothetical protein